jgi:hypothetical protein
VTTRRGLWAIALLPALACSASENKNPYLPPTGGGGSGVQTMPSGTVAVTILSPATPQNASMLTLASNSDVSIRATVDVQGGTDFVDTTSVKATLTATGSTAPVAAAELVSTGGDVFTGTLSLGNLKAGTYTLTVSAASSTGTIGQATLGIAVDDGPVVMVSSPTLGGHYNGSLTVELTADFGPIGPSTTVSPNPSATVGGLSVSGFGADGTANAPPNSYRGTVDFSSYSPPLTGMQLLDVKATNANGVTTDVQVLFDIDNTGPTITMTNPEPGEVVGGVVNVQATVTDDSGVLDSSVIAIIGDQNTPVFELPLAPQGSGLYGALFDTANLTQCQEPPATSLCLVYPTISFRASDTLGNQTVIGYDFSVDNIAPVADLDPPEERQLRLGLAGFECSLAFDPLSLNRDLGDMPNDGCMVPQVFDLRARIEDDGNRAAGLKIVPIAGIDPDNTSVYILSDTSQPLVVDSNGDGSCDEINPLLVPTTDPPTMTNQVLKIRLGGIPPAGSADFDFQPGYPPLAQDPPLPLDAPCGPGTSTAPPHELCTFQQPTIAISYAGGDPAVWSVEPYDPAFRCLGNQFDALANNIPEGWACIAVGTADKVGNKSVSAPMRVFIQYTENSGFCATPPVSAGAPPTCTGKFLPSPDPTMPGTTTGGACTARKFSGTEYYCPPGAC